MAYEQRDNSGSLFKNDRKEQPNHPDYRGSAMIDGREYWVSAWLKKSQNGTPFMSFSYQPKDEQQSRQQQRKAPPDENFDNGDIPF